MHKWTYEEILGIAKRYFREMDFRKENPNSYMFAKKHGFIDKIIQEADLCPLRVIISKEIVFTILEEYKNGSNVYILGRKYHVSPETDYITPRVPLISLFWYRHLARTA